MENEKVVETQERQNEENELMVQQIILGKDREITKLEKELASLTNRSLAVHKKNEQMLSSPELNNKMALLDYELRLAKQFSESKAFPTASPEQIYTLMKAGEEMGLTPIVSLNLLYVVNGHINPYGDKMLGYILGKGYRVEYMEEDSTKVTVRIYNPNNESEEYIETATTNDQIIKKSMIKGAGSFALKNKLRFHAIRMIASFHLPHLFMGCGDNFSPDFDKWVEGEEMKITNKKGNTVVVVSDEDILSRINEANDLDELDELMESHKPLITKDINLVSAFGAKKKEFQS